MTEASCPADRLDPKDVALRGRIGAYRLHATHDPRTTDALARAPFLSPFEAEVDPDGMLEPGERRRRAMRSAQARCQRPGSAPGRDVALGAPRDGRC